MSNKNENVDEATWRRKDDLSARQTAANVTGYVFEGKEPDIDAFLEYSEKIRKWLFENQLPVESPEKKEKTAKKDKTIDEEPAESTDTPQPTQQQDKVLKAIAKKVKVKAEVVRQKVYEHYNKYPRNEKSIDEIIKKVNFKE